MFLNNLFLILAVFIKYNKHQRKNVDLSEKKWIISRVRIFHCFLSLYSLYFMLACIVLYRSFFYSVLTIPEILP